MKIIRVLQSGKQETGFAKKEESVLRTSLNAVWYLYYYK